MPINIAGFWEKGKYWLLYSSPARQAYEVLILLAIAAGAFACGRLSAIEERSAPVAIENIFANTVSSSEKTIQKTTIGEPEEGRGAPVQPIQKRSVVASKNSDKYHLPWCSGAGSIKEENKIWFATEADAIAAGYTKAGNCK